MWACLKANGELLSQLAGVLQSLAAVVALIVGGIWTFRLFVKNRLNKPCATSGHLVTTRHLQGNGLLVHIGVEVKNESAVMMRLTSGEVRLVPILPLSEEAVLALDAVRKPARCAGEDAEVTWPGTLQYTFDWSKDPREIEPHESDTFHFDFVAADALTTFQVYSYLRNEAKGKRDIGWSTTTFHDVEE